MGTAALQAHESGVGEGELAVARGGEVTVSSLRVVDAASRGTGARGVAVNPADTSSARGITPRGGPRPGQSPGRLALPLAVADGGALAVAWTVSPTAPEAVLIVLVAMTAVFALTGRYSGLRLNLTVIDDLPYLAAAVIVGYAPSVMARGLAGASVPGHALMEQAAVLTLAVAAFRTGVYCAVRRSRHHVSERHRTVILGSGSVGSRLASALKEHPGYGLEPVGFLDSEPRSSRLSRLPIPVLGTYDRLSSIILDKQVSRLIVAYGGRGEADLVDVLRTVDRLDVEVAVVPRLYELHSARQGVEEVRGVPLVWRRRHGPRRLSWPVKRAFDVVVSVTSLLLLSPVLLAAALAVRLEGGPGVIFRQHRVGLDGREFELFKFRSMRPADDHESQTNWNVSQDSRLGPVGRFLRRSSIDELPQLWNVVRGDMTLVGPRPERQFFVDQFSSQFRGYPARHRVPVGLTGWAQAHGLRGDTSIEERARFDNYYIENWSLWLDVKILVKTVGQVLRRQGG